MKPDPSAADAHRTGSAEDLFGKLDQLLSRHQLGPQRSAPPVLDDAVEAAGAAREAPPERADDGIPILHDVVEEDTQLHDAQPMGLRQRQLQAALYLRLRQRLDEQLASSAGGQMIDDALARFARSLRNALPEIVRTSVEQVFTAPESGDRPR